ncbi:MAG TPA: glucose-6-phosphate isomerase [Bacillota bacterium]|nr:glucose-6-phosphate isomerase [Bacillota bacterium]
MNVVLNDIYIKDFVTPDDMKALSGKLADAHEKIVRKNGAGNDFIGWRDLPVEYDKDEFNRIKHTAKRIITNSDVLLVIGIGGSYLGARAAQDFLCSPNYNCTKKKTPDVYFIGCSLSSDELYDAMQLCEGKDVSVIVISKSGTTTEPALAFRVIRQMMEAKYRKDELRERIVVTTDKAHGMLRALAAREGYDTFVVPDDIGGRFSVLTAVGLLPIACMGVDIDAIMAGAQRARDEYLGDGMDCAPYRYAVLRHAMYAKGRNTELLCSYENAFRYMCEWWKQLFGESEGKQHKGIFPASVIFTTDLHSMGQYIQDGERHIFETVVFQKSAKNIVKVPFDSEDPDGLNFIAGVPFTEVNKKAFLGTVIAHSDGGVPNIVIEYEKRDEATFGELVYFFELACAASAYMLGVNPFDQPGVEQYKKNMFALLGKPGYEKLSAELNARVNKLNNIQEEKQ